MAGQRGQKYRTVCVVQYGVCDVAQRRTNRKRPAAGADDHGVCFFGRRDQYGGCRCGTNDVVGDAQAGLFLTYSRDEP